MTKPLTEVELEMMNVIWRLGPCSVKQILAALPPERPLAYTSVSTIVRILEQKQFVISHKEGRGHLYEASLSKSDYQKKSVTDIVRNVFDDTPASLVRQLLSSGALTPDELEEIKALIEARS